MLEPLISCFLCGCGVVSVSQMLNDCFLGHWSLLCAKLKDKKEIRWANYGEIEQIVVDEDEVGDTFLVPAQPAKRNKQLSTTFEGVHIWGQVGNVEGPKTVLTVAISSRLTKNPPIYHHYF